jgi:hypothetical protein
MLHDPETEIVDASTAIRVNVTYTIHVYQFVLSPVFIADERFANFMLDHCQYIHPFRLMAYRKILNIYSA